MDKQKEYRELVKKRQSKQYSNGLVNASQIDNGIYDCDHISPWSQWQGNLDAKILLIGQDWGNLDYFRKNKGKDNDYEPTSNNLKYLFKSIGFEIGVPSKPVEKPLFFTNAVLGIKEDAKSGDVKDSWVTQDLDLNKRLIEIIKPKIIITLGAKALSCINKMYGLGNNTLTNKIKDNANPTELGKDKNIQHFAFYHCSCLGLVNRGLELQIEDWEKVIGYL